MRSHTSPIHRTLAALCAALLFGIAMEELTPRLAGADDWMFRRSYYSHEPMEGEDRPVPPVPARTAYRRAYTGEGPGFSLRGGYRYNIHTMRSGNNVDVTVLRENWFEFAP